MQRIAMIFYLFYKIWSIEIIKQYTSIGVSYERILYLGYGIVN